MNRITTLALCLVLTGSPGLMAQAASTPLAKANYMLGVPEKVIRCTQTDETSAVWQPCNVRQAIQLGSDVSRQEFECVLSGNCGVADRSRVSG